MYYNYKQKNGKSSKIPYTMAGIGRLVYPNLLLRLRRDNILNTINTREDRQYINDRVEYYNKLNNKSTLAEDSRHLSELSLLKEQSAYFFDSYEYIRWFDPSLKWSYLFGDITSIPETPSIVKSRPIDGCNQNSVLLNLDKLRHFTIMKDKLPFDRKLDKIIFRGDINDKPARISFMEKYFDHPLCDCGIINPTDIYPKEWEKPVTIWDHLRYKFILALEGNDVASNLKWIFSSNSVAVMPRPTYETWFMEGRLIPEYHYIEIKRDHSDLAQKLEYYIDHPEEADRISQNANQYIAQFLNPERERLISLAVLDKYFKLTNAL